VKNKEFTGKKKNIGNYRNDKKIQEFTGNTGTLGAQQ